MSIFAQYPTCECQDYSAKTDNPDNPENIGTPDLAVESYGYSPKRRRVCLSFDHSQIGYWATWL